MCALFRRLPDLQERPRKPVLHGRARDPDDAPDAALAEARRLVMQSLELGPRAHALGDRPDVLVGWFGDAHSSPSPGRLAAHPLIAALFVLIAHGGFGAEVGAPAAKDIYSAFFGLGRHLPSRGYE